MSSLKCQVMKIIITTKLEMISQQQSTPHTYSTPSLWELHDKSDVLVAINGNS